MSNNNLQLVDFKSGEILFKEGDRNYFFYMIKTGEVEIFKNQSDDTEVSLATIGEGQALGEFAMIDKQPRSASARALSNVIAVRVSEEGYQDLLNDIPSWAKSMMENLVVRLRKANEIIKENEKITHKMKADTEASEYSTDSNISFNFDFNKLSIKED